MQVVYKYGRNSHAFTPITQINVLSYLLTSIYNENAERLIECYYVGTGIRSDQGSLKYNKR